MRKKVIFAMSGGVDSSVGAYLLKQQGFDVIGVTMNVGSEEPVKDAKIIAEKLGIPHYAADLRNDFKQKVIAPFIGEYVSGRTPNPCVLCNPSIKWEILMSKLEEFNADYVATGHYAEKVCVNGKYSIKQADNTAKDQTYALYRLTQRQLEKTLMPLYKYTKNEVRDIAKSAGLEVYDKPDSQEICFIDNNDYKDYIEKYLGKAEAPGEFVLESGEVLGIHRGISKYTVGQRKGLGISYSEPLFVLKIDVMNNRVVLGKNERLFKNELTAGNVIYSLLEQNGERLKCFGKIRYAHAAAKCEITANEKIHCIFDEPQRAITPGQSAVFYTEDGIVLAGGMIELS